MIANTKSRCPGVLTDQQRDHFLSLLPTIAEQAKYAFRSEGRELREELVAETIANAFVAFTRLVERGLTSIIYVTPLTQYAVRQVRDGRRVGCRMNNREVLSEYAQRNKRFTVERLDRFDADKGEWREVLLEDRRAGPAETAAARIDIGDWFVSLPRRKRRLAEKLATGLTTKKAASKFRLSPGRISQVRRELMESWREFQGEPAAV